MRKSQCEPNRWKGFAAGVLGSLAGLYTMSLYWKHVAPRLQHQAEQRDGHETAESSAPQALDDISIPGRLYWEGESSTAALGRILYQRVAGHEPPAEETKTLLSNLVHWAYGMLQGGLYGAVRHAAHGLDMRAGLAWATGLWLFGDELAVPLLGLQSGPTAVPAMQHLHRGGAHLAYGTATAVTSQVLRRLL